tara:strand:+ start:5764 stop:6684 length:921 start_codon:yes stop_codon:yes gene_type:complete
MEQQQIPKKRGRKPLNKTKQKNPNDAPKRRGRKPKDKIGTIDSSSKIITEENIILQLPIYEEETVETEVPQPFSSNIDDNYMNVPLNISIEQEEPETVEKTDYDELLKTRNNELKQKENTSKELLIDFLEYKKMGQWPNKTSIPCMNDNHTFNCKPCGIPIKIENNKCIMYGNFCSPSCAAAFNFDTNLDSNVFERYSLLNHVYNNSEPVFIANSKLLINTWGGIYSIDEYRRLNKNFKRVNVEVYPFVATIPTLEETSYDLDITKPINFDKDKLKKVSAEYKLKRSKPLPDHKNTLESCMNLKFV